MYSTGIVSVIRAAVVFAMGAALCLQGAALAQVLPLTHYTTDSEPRALPSAEVHSVHQDRLGFVWAVVYSSGLARYDGTRMEVYGMEDGLRSLALWDVVEDSRGYLWVASNSGVVVSDLPLWGYGPGERVRFVSERGGVALAGVAIRRNAIAEAPDGSVWVGTGDVGIVRYRTGPGGPTADTLSTAPTPGAANLPVFSILARGDGSMWVGAGGGRLLVYEGEDALREHVPLSPPANVFAMHEAPDGQLWGGSSGGRLWRQDSRGDFEEIPHDRTGTIHSIVSRGDELLVTSEGSGLLILDRAAPERQTAYTRLSGLLSDVIHRVTFDREGNMWLAQSGGLSKLRHNYAAFRGFNARSQIGEPPVLPAAAVGAVQPTPDDPACAVWAGTSAGVTCIHHGWPARSSHLTSAEGLPADWVNAVLRDGQGRLWVGTSRGIAVVAPEGVAVPAGPPGRAQSLDGRAHRVTPYGGSTILSATSLDLGEGSRESLLFAGVRIVFALLDGEWYQLGEATGLPPAVMHAVARDGAGHLWVGTRDRGLFRSTIPVGAATIREHALPAEAGGGLGRRVEVDLFEPIWSKGDGAPTDQIESLLWDGDVMWIATPAGLFATRSGSSGGLDVLAHLDAAAGMGASQVYSLAISPTTGTLWAGTNGGLTEIDRERKRPLRTITRRNGLIDNEVWYYGSVRIDEEGRVFFGTAQGLSIYDPSRDHPAPPIERVLLRRASYTASRGRQNEALFEYAAVSFSSEGAVRYRTRLRGFDQDWSEPTAEARIRYTNLPAILLPRRYTFEVTASNQDGVWTETPLTHSFKVAPPWYLHGGMFALYGLVLAGGAVSANRVQRRRIVARMRAEAQLQEAQHRAQQAAVQQEAAEARARALQAENERKEVELSKARELEQAYNELKQTQAQLIQAEKMASLGQLTAGIAHEIKNPLNFVNNFSKASIELVDELREELQQLLGEEDQQAIEFIMGDLVTMSGKIAEHGERADRIVKAMLQHSRGQSGTFQTVKLNDFIEEYVNLAFHGMRAQYSDFNVTLERDYDEAAGSVDMVAQEFGRVLINLLNNAFYAVYTHGRTVGGDFSPRVLIRTQRDGSRVSLEVEDNGPGIPEDIRDRIFEPFFTTKPTGEGTGLGLSLSYDIITQMHAGELKLESGPDSGTRFRVAVPAGRSSSQSAHSNSAAKPVAQPA